MWKIKTAFLLLAVALLCCSSISPPGRAEPVFNPETEEGYFILSDYETQYMSQGHGDIFLLQFEEDGHLRYLMAYITNMTEYGGFPIKDFFTGETVMMTNTLGNSSIYLKEPYWINEKYFKDGTDIRNLELDGHKEAAFLW